MLPRPVCCIPAETNGVVQVKYTNQSSIVHIPHGLWTLVTTQLSACHKHAGGKKYTFDSRIRLHLVTSCAVVLDASLSFSGSNQARKGRLVNALAVRGDERRDTLR
jgi:hypothetical protein